MTRRLHRRGQGSGRRHAAGITVVAALGLAAAACSGSPATSGGGDGHVTISVDCAPPETIADDHARRRDFTLAGVICVSGLWAWPSSVRRHDSHAEYVAGTDLADMIKEDLIAERIAIDSYGEIIRYLGDDDVTSRRLMEEILAVEEQHAEDMSTLLGEIKPGRA